jgi:hypothetical protein
MKCMFAGEEEENMKLELCTNHKGGATLHPGRSKWSGGESVCWHRRSRSDALNWGLGTSPSLDGCSLLTEKGETRGEPQGIRKWELAELDS